MRYDLKSKTSKYKKMALIIAFGVHAGFFSAMALSGYTDQQDTVIQNVKDWFTSEKEADTKIKKMKKSRAKQA